MNDLYDIIADKTTLQQAWMLVKAKGSAGGIDGVSIQQFDLHTENHINLLHEELKAGEKFRQQAVDKSVFAMITKGMKAFVIFAYDISSNRRRNKVAKLLESYGERANYSVFELLLSAKQIHQVVNKLSEMIQHNTDKVIIYQLCRQCADKKIEIGRLCPQDKVRHSIVLR